MLAAKYRFHGYAAFKFLFGHGKTYRFKSFSLRVAHNPRRTHSRAAVVVSKKVLKAAPKRNRIRRRMYEELRQQWGNVKPAHDILLTIYDPAFKDEPHERIQEELTEALKRARLWIGAGGARA